MDTIIAAVPKNAVEDIRVAVRQDNGRDLVDVRVYDQDDGGVWKPTRKEICLTVEQWPELREALAQVDKHLPTEASTPPRRRSPRGEAKG